MLPCNEHDQTRRGTVRSNSWHLLALLSLGLVQNGCAGLAPRNVRAEPRYSATLGQRFELGVSCYVFFPSGTKEVPLLSPDNAPHERLPLPVDAKHIGHVFAEGKIIGIVPKGTVFRIVDVVRKTSLEYDILMYYVALEIPSDGIPATLNAYRLFNQYEDVPSIIPKFGKRVGPVREGP
jgi:hypothetical protein